jgi:hypothetical protein
MKLLVGYCTGTSLDWFPTTREARACSAGGYVPYSSEAGEQYYNDHLRFFHRTIILNRMDVCRPHNITYILTIRESKKRTIIDIQYNYRICMYLSLLVNKSKVSMYLALLLVLFRLLDPARSSTIDQTTCFSTNYTLYQRLLAVIVDLPIGHVMRRYCTGRRRCNQ